MPKPNPTTNELALLAAIRFLLQAKELGSIAGFGLVSSAEPDPESGAENACIITIPVSGDGEGETKNEEKTFVADSLEEAATAAVTFLAPPSDALSADPNDPMLFPEG